MNYPIADPEYKIVEEGADKPMDSAGRSATIEIPVQKILNTDEQNVVAKERPEKLVPRLTQKTKAKVQKRAESVKALTEDDKALHPAKAKHPVTVIKVFTMTQLFDDRISIVGDFAHLHYQTLVFVGAVSV